MNWSASNGHVNIGTLLAFHPQWVKNSPTSPCRRIDTYGAHPFSMRPLLASRFWYPSGIRSSPCRIKFTPLHSRAAVRTLACLLVRIERLLKTYRTKLEALSFSDIITWWSSTVLDPPLLPSLLSFFDNKGPTAQTWLCFICFLTPSMKSPSRSANEFKKKHPRTNS